VVALSETLALLFVCNPGEICSPFLAPRRIAAPRLLVEHRTKAIKALLSRALVDAISYTDVRNSPLLS